MVESLPILTEGIVLCGICGWRIAIDDGLCERCFKEYVQSAATDAVKTTIAMEPVEEGSGGTSPSDGKIRSNSK